MRGARPNLQLLDHIVDIATAFLGVVDRTQEDALGNRAVFFRGARLAGTGSRGSAARGAAARLD